MADAVALASAAGALSHAVLTEASPNQATSLSSLQYSCLATQANVYGGGGAFPFETPPRIEAIHAGPAIGRRPSGGELVTGGEEISEAPAGRLISIVGSDFSADRSHNLVTIGGRPAPLSSLSTNTVLATVLPFPEEGAEEVAEVRVHVRGVPANAVEIGILPAQRAPGAPFILSKRVLKKQQAFLAWIGHTDWLALPAAGSASSARPSEEEEEEAVGRMQSCAQDLTAQLKEFETQLNSNAHFLETYESVLHSSPEVEQLLDEALALFSAQP
ncbi:MAG TPA: IPT/TIG domain-containing protein [Acidobacteriota bacterium]|nr:IPT/TIG domain-containing protein [Acidobacteriota bacterium]